MHELPDGWSQPDLEGISKKTIVAKTKNALKKERLLRVFFPKKPTVAIWPTEWQALTSLLLKSKVKRENWKGLQKKANDRGYLKIVNELFEGLFQEGYIEVKEKHDAGSWFVDSFVFVDKEKLWQKLGLPDPEAEREAWLLESAIPLDDLRLENARDSLDKMHVRIARKRLEILWKLKEWEEKQCVGTYRDFSLEALDDTKEIQKKHLKWLKSHLDLQEFGVEGHAYVLWLKGPLVLHRADCSLDLGFVNDFLALTINDILKITSIEGNIDTWRLIESRTSFERVASRSSEGLIWLLGYASESWKKAVRHILQLKPAPAIIACDPDPWGIEIALHAAAIWDELKIVWTPWMMNVDVFKNFSKLPDLTEQDKSKLYTLKNKDSSNKFSELIDWMLENEKKAEQEGYI